MRVIIISNGFEYKASEVTENEVNLRRRDNGLQSQLLPKKITKKRSVHRNQSRRVLVYKLSHSFFSNPIWGKNRGGGWREEGYVTYLYRPNNRFKAMHPKGERFMRVLVSFVFLFNKEHTISSSILL